MINHLDRIKRVIPFLRSLSYVGLGICFGSVSIDKRASFIFGLAILSMGQGLFYILNPWRKEK